MDYQKMMADAIEAQKKAMEDALQRALDQQKKMNEEMGFETTEEDRQELIDEYRQQGEAQIAMMQQQMQMQAAMMENIQGNPMQAYSDVLQNIQDNIEENEDEDEEMTDEEYQAFVQANTPSAEYAKYLPIGALLIGTHGEPYGTLKLIQDGDYTSEVLENGWGIDDREDALDMMESLLKGRHAVKFEKELKYAKEGNFEKMDEGNAEDYQTSVSGITEVLELPMELVDKCTTLYAWDLERIGYLARLFVNVGYISEEEAWEWMRKAGAEIKKNFNSWEEYFVSLLLGRGFAMGVHQEPYAVAYDLLVDNKDFLSTHPISNLA